MRMLTRSLPALFVFASLASADPVQLTGDWWQGPAERTRHATLVASYDSPESNDAEYARQDPRSGGFGMTLDAPGKNGLATVTGERGAHIHYNGGGNFQAEHGTLRMLVKGDLWADETPRWIFDARGKNRIGVVREPGKLSLCFSQGRSTTSFISRLDLDIGDVSGSEWHSVVASWDKDLGMGWIALDGQGVSGEMDFSPDARPAFAVYVAGGADARAGGMNLPGLAVDDVVLYDVSLPLLEAELAKLPEVEAEFLPVAEAGARKTLDFLADLQRWGGWQCIYTWPTLIGSSAQGREWADFDDYIDMDKGNGTPRTALNFLYAYRALGDYRSLDVLLRVCDMLMASQDERGFWVHGYRMTVNGLVPLADDRHIKFQDQVQAHPMLLLSALYRMTGEEAYLDAVKRAGEFYIAAQNPNGSWSHHYNAQDGVGENARGEPHGGELNDRAMNDAIEMMALMYHITGEAKYVAALRRGGDWLVQSQGDPVPMWADQYDGDDNPAWARNFEPPAYGTTATINACQALREVFRFSGDEKYVEPIRATVAWLEEFHPDGKISYYTEPGTGRAVAGWDNKLYYLDDPASIRYLDTQAIGSGYTKMIDLTPTIKRLLQQAESGPPAPTEVTQESALASLPGLRKGAQSALDTQNEAGVWVVPNVANYKGSLGVGFGATSPRTVLILRYVEAARIAMGEIEPQNTGGGDFRTLAYPEDDWYELNWGENAG
ncbi:MAG TPA: pectate lyase [Armatimonadota bacterium]|nr:pectate lyase [Armatimonadota bacterium]